MKHILILIVAFMPLLCCAQKEDYVWVMGNNIIDFNTTPPTVRANGDFAYEPGLTSVCDSDGNLVYWVNGKHLYNSQNEIINTSDFYSGMDYLVTLRLFPLPGSEYKYIFLSLKKGIIYFTLVDGSKDILHPDLIENFATMPYNESWPIIVQKNNSRDYWIIHEDSEAFYVYALTKNGLTLNSSRVHQREMGNDVFYSYMLGGSRMSRNQTKIFAFESSFVDDLLYLYIDFDNEHGVINDIIFHRGAGVEFWMWVFTPNEKYFYYTLYTDTEERNNKIFRCPVDKLKEPDALKKYGQLVHTFPTGFFIDDMKIAPDGNIYFMDEDNNKEYVGIIFNPEDDNPIVEFEALKMAQPIKEVHWAVSFPLTYHYPFGLSYTRDCHDFTFSFSESKYESVVWNFGDGTAEVRDVEKPTHTFADDGKYTVNLTVTLTDGIVREYSTDVEITTPKMPRIIVEE